MSIQVYGEINESHAATGFTGRTDLPAFHIFTVEEIYSSISIFNLRSRLILVLQGRREATQRHLT